MNNNNDLFDGLGVEILLKSEEDFLKIVETLTRIGVLSRDNVLTQTCHILHKRGKYSILHFKELFKLDGISKSDISDEDLEAAADEAIDDEDLEMYDPEDHEAEEGETVDISSEEELELEDETV